MIELTEQQYRILSSSDKKQTVHIPAGNRQVGEFVIAKKCPVIEGHSYLAWARFRANPRDEVKKHEVRITVMHLTVLDAGEGWDVEVQRGDRSDLPRLLGKKAGYTQSTAAAMTGDLDPGEAVPEWVQRQWSQEAFERDKLNRQQRIDMAREGVAFLWGGGRDEKRAARQIERQLDRLIGEEKAA